MKEVKFSLNRFDLTGFIEEIFNFMKLNDISPEVVACFTEDGGVAELKADLINEDYIRNLLILEKILFLPFSDINVGEPIPCADGGQYIIANLDGLDEEVAVSSDGVESIGFLIQVKQEMIEICPAAFKGGSYEEIDSQEMEEDLKEFSEPMSRFVDRYVKN